MHLYFQMLFLSWHSALYLKFLLYTIIMSMYINLLLFLGFQISNTSCILLDCEASLYDSLRIIIPRPLIVQ
jgi:hypothetical protein